MCREYEHTTADPTLRELASEKLAKINAAYELLRQSEPVYWGLDASNGSLCMPDSKGLVRCFFCHQKCRLPTRDHFDTARCPRCQALLLFEEDLARAFLAAD